MLLFNKKDMQIICKYDGETVTFSKPLKDILKYQYKYNYRFKLYTTEGYIIADDFKIEDDVLTVLFGTVTVTYSASGAEYNDTTGSGGGSGSGCECDVVAVMFNAEIETEDGTISTLRNVYAWNGTEWVNLTDGEPCTVYISKNKIVDDKILLHGYVYQDVNTTYGGFYTDPYMLLHAQANEDTPTHNGLYITNETIIFNQYVQEDNIKYFIIGPDAEYVYMEGLA